MRTSFHHQPEAQHPKSPAIETPVGRLPHLWSASSTGRRNTLVSQLNRSTQHLRNARQLYEPDADCLFQLCHSVDHFLEAVVAE
jgi:hypothetical protein